MSRVIDRILSDICIDERIKDGIFKLDDNIHLEVLRDYFINKGIAKEAAIHVTNRMLEGKYPERQAFRTEDHILVTFPSPQHKAKAMAKNPGKYTDKDPRPKSPQSKPEPKLAPPGSKPEPGELPSKDDVNKGEKSLPKSNIDEPDGKKEPTIFQGDQKLEIEPPRGAEKPITSRQPTLPTTSPVPRTPERVAAEKEVVKQLFSTDDTTLSGVDSPVTNLNEANLKYQLHELYKKADEWNFREAVTFLTKYVML